MKKLLLTLLVLLAAHIANTANAHEGMIALYSDQSTSSCQAILPELTIINLSLFYIKGDGPVMGNACEFRLRKSTDGITFASPDFSPIHGIVLTFGNLESGISIAYGAGGGWCPADSNVSFLGIIPVLNTSDPDTFTVSVVEDPMRYWDPKILITLCNAWGTSYEVIGGTFVFNGTCNNPEDPFGNALGIESSSWGAIKEIFSE